MKDINYLIDQILIKKHNSHYGFIDKSQVETFVLNLYKILFLPNKINTKQNLKNDIEEVQQILYELILSIVKDEKITKKHVEDFFHILPDIYDKLILDAESVLEFDPATDYLEEILLAYPGNFATYAYRISHQLWSQGLKIVPRVISEYAHSKTGIDIHPGAEIGSYFFIDHGTGIVIGETTIIGNHVKIYQGVTLGALNVSKKKANQKRHPTIEDNVIIYANATILGGETTIGKESTIGGNVWITQNVPSNSLVYNKSEIRIKNNNQLPESLNFVI